MTNPLIRPDLSQFKNAVDLSSYNSRAEIEAEALQRELFGDQIVDVTPTEIAQLKEMVLAAQRDFEGIYSSITSLSVSEKTKHLRNWSVRWGEKFDEAGWAVIPDAFNVELDKDGVALLSPIINVLGRRETEFDFDKASGEIQAGLYDGQVGRIMEDGTWRDPKSVI